MATSRIQRMNIVLRFTVIKKNITWNSNDTITYVSSRKWIFVPELSNGTESDYVTQVNPVAVVSRPVCIFEVGLSVIFHLTSVLILSSLFYPPYTF